MMNMSWKMLRFELAVLLCTGLALPISAAAAGRAPVIKHQPVTIAAQGQAIAMRATATSDSALKSVTLCYSTSKDVAPFKLQMQAAGVGLFVTAIPANLISRASQITYYIEAIDAEGLATETPEYVVKIQSPQAGSQSAATPGGGARSEEESFWSKPAVIGGGLLLAGGATAAILASSSGSDSDSSSPGSTNSADAGTYVGSATLVKEISGQAAESSTHGITMTIGSDGSISSDTLYEEQHLQGNLAGSSFTLTAAISTTNMTGQIQFNGSVENGRISGSAGGTFQVTSTGANGVYYGNFYAVRQ